MPFDALEKLKGETLAFKIDVEGHELQVLMGMSETLENNCCWLQIESFEENQDALDDFLSAKDYKKIYQIGEDQYYTNLVP